MALAVEVHLVREDVEGDAEIGEADANVFEDPGLGVLAAEIRCVLALGEVNAVLAKDLIGQVGDISPLVAIAGEEHRQTVDLRGPVRLVGIESFERGGSSPAQALEHASVDGVSEHPHLASAVVEVVLPRDLVTRCVQQTREHVADHGLATVAEGQRTGGVGRDELDLNALSASGRGTAEFRSEFQHEAHQVLPAALRQPQVQEARSRDLAARYEPTRFAELGSEPFGDRPGRLPQPLGNQHGGVTSEIAVVRTLRNIERKFRKRTRVARRVEQLANRQAQPFEKPLLHLAGASPEKDETSKFPGT